jgi:hypothetical protein
VTDKLSVGSTLSGERAVSIEEGVGRDPVFVFGSNLAGRHGKGAALFARQHRGAIYGRGIGRQGNSYAIPTKDGQLRTLRWRRSGTMSATSSSTRESYQTCNSSLRPSGAGWLDTSISQIAPMFYGAPPNVDLPPEFKDYRLGQLVMDTLRDSAPALSPRLSHGEQQWRVSQRQR